MLSVLAACGFEHGSLTTGDAADSKMPDTPITPTWQIDGTSKKAVPTNAAQWTDLSTAYNLGLAAPQHLWQMQETSGSLGDSAGAVSLAPLNGPSYGNPIAGWTRVAVGTTDSQSTQGFYTSALGALNGTSYLLLIYAEVAATPSAQRSLCGIGANSDHRYVALTTTPTLEAAGVGVTTGNGVIPLGSDVHPVVLVVDSTHQKFVVYTDDEKLSAGWANTTGAAGGLLVVGDAVIGAAPARYLYAASWSGAAAEWDDAKVKATLKALGWTVTGF